MKKNVIVVTGGLLETDNAKTAHGLIRGSSRFNVAGLVDHKNSGKDAGVVLDGVHRGIPVFESLEQAISSSTEIAYVVVGVATKGGVIPDTLLSVFREAISSGVGIVNGLHDLVSSRGELVALAKEKGVEIIDVRKPKSFRDLHFWSGKIRNVTCPIIPVLGTDCALGKRTTTRILVEEMIKCGYKAEMIYTGQTGWMQGAKYGFIFDSTLNDFVSGELEFAICECFENEKPDIIFIEGQSALRNPSGPAGSEWIISARASGVVLQHDPVRTQYKDMEYYPALIPSLRDEIELIRILGAPTLAITLNTSQLTDTDARKRAAELSAELGIPVVLPLEDGVAGLVSVFEKLIKAKA